MAKDNLYIIDGSALAYRSYFGMVKAGLTRSDGFPTGACYAFTNSMLNLVENHEPDHIVMVFDASEKTFRHEIFPDYKATREAMPDDLVRQLPYLHDLTRALNIEVIIEPGFEADDILGTLAQKAKKKNMEIFMVTGDKDLMQILDEDVYMYKPGRGRREDEIITTKELKEKWNIKPQQVADFLALMGDSSDNIPGVKGIGEKRASRLLNNFESIEEIYKNLDKIDSKRIRNYLKKGEEEAKFSKKLTTIDTDVAVKLDLNKFKHNKFDKDKLIAIFKELEFHSLIQRFQDDQENIRKKKNYQAVKSEKELDEIVDKYANSELLSFDLETTSIDPMKAEIVGIALSDEKHTGVYVPVDISEKQKTLFADKPQLSTLEQLKPILENQKIKKCGQNLKYDMLILRRYGIEVQGLYFDTIVAAFLLQPDDRKFNLGRLSQKYLYYQMQPIEELIGKGKNQKSMADVPLEEITFYACEDADVAFQLTTILKEKLTEKNLDEIYYDIEIPLIPVLMDMEENGVYVEIPYLQKMSDEIAKKIDSISEKIYDEAGIEFNVNSPKQLSEVLFDRLELPQIRKRSTAEKVLKKLEDKSPIPSLVLEYRKLSKLKSTYLDALPELVNKRTGRIHSSFNQTIASTGRLTSSSPNFQNIPIRTEIGKKIRKAFKPAKEGYKIISADYSQIELRIMAHLSQDPNLVDAFESDDVDIHSRTAALVNGVDEADVTPKMRRAAKVVNYGIMYGAGAYRLSNELNISMQKARELKDKYFETYPGINQYILNTLEKARENGFVTTLAGRIRYTHGINSDNKNKKRAAERTAINLPIQGTAADMIKIAMININNRLNNGDWQTMMILQVHDELIFEVPNQEVDQLVAMVRKEMEAALPLDIPVKVDIGIGKSWYEAH
ncbi:MAG: DNA polymerase I [Candidatus Marinimicrobia bacterium]|nr:DNA polymerase I [Candidatus Neomarinimicrobiota bacterium]